MTPFSLTFRTPDDRDLSFSAPAVPLVGDNVVANGARYRVKSVTWYVDDLEVDEPAGPRKACGVLVTLAKARGGP